MARYGLIMKDATYMKLMKLAAEQGISMGRLLNDIVDKAVMEEKLDIEMVCTFCEGPAEYKGFLGDQTHLYCGFHFERDKHLLGGWREL